MILRYFYDRTLAQASYLLGCAQTGEALVVDPGRQITPYLAAAAAEGLTITQVAETHIHADFVSGVRELAAATGARIFLSQAGDTDWQYGYATQPGITLIADGAGWQVGNIRIDVLHTPGHTPEHLCFLVTDTAGADRPMGLLSGDCVFVGDVGRPDLLDAVAGFHDTRFAGAAAQFASVQRLKTLPDYLQIWPGHGAGSACGKALGAVPSTTLGYEKLFNPAFQFTEAPAFSAWLLTDQPEAPAYFAQMKRVNRDGPALLTTLSTPAQVGADAVQQAIDAGDLVIDLRPGDQFAAGHLPGTLSVPATSTMYTSYIGAFIDYTRPLYLIAPDEATTHRAIDDLRAIGADRIGGYALPASLPLSATLPVITTGQIPPTALIVDVRQGTEYAERHIVGSRHMPLNMLTALSSTLPTDRPLVIQCASGYRSRVAASWLRRAGFAHITALADPLAVWSQILPTETGSPTPQPG